MQDVNVFKRAVNVHSSHLYKNIALFIFLRLRACEGVCVRMWVSV
jgi:hypothetical protein